MSGIFALAPYVWGGMCHCLFMYGIVRVRACEASASIDIEVDGKHPKESRLTAGFFVVLCVCYVVTHNDKEVLGETVQEPFRWDGRLLVDD